MVTIALETLFENAKEMFVEIFGETPTFGSFSAGRVNLIGEHTDYNDGFVMPLAVPLFTVIVGIEAVDSNKSHIFSTCASQMENFVEFRLPFIDDVETFPKWSRYFLGVLKLMDRKSPNFIALIHSSVPLGGGLSSSASLEMATFKFIDFLLGNSGEKLDPVKASLLCQKAEHVYAHVPCGIMDQFSCALSKEKHAMLLDCRTLEYEFLPLDDPEIVILVTNSNVKHDLSTSAYAERRKTCLESAKKLGKLSLRDVKIEDLYSNDSLDGVALKRVRHVVTEIYRTSAAALALKSRDYCTFGKLMNESHASLKDDYEVSCAELDQLQQIAVNCKGVYGSRMTGGGFGGCTVTLVRRDAIEKLCEEIQANYKGNPTFYVCTAVDGSGTRHF